MQRQDRKNHSSESGASTVAPTSKKKAYPISKPDSGIDIEQKVTSKKITKDLK